MLEQVVPAAAFALVSTLTPGGATAVAAASGARWGFRRSVGVLAGIAAGLAAMAASAAAGLAGLVVGQPTLQLGMKLAGTAYLLWLAVRIGCSGPPRLQVGPLRPAGFAAGVGMVWSNPKGWAMTVSAAASFATPASGPAGLAALLGIVFGAAACASLSAWCAAGQVMARLLRTDRQWLMLNAALAVLLVASVVPVWL